MGRAQQGGRPTPAWLLVPGVIESLKASWIAGTPTAEMARLFGTTTGAIIGKVHRLGLDPRPAPYGFPTRTRAVWDPLDAADAPPPVAPLRTLPPLESEQAAPRPVAAPIPIAAPRVAAPIPKPRPIPKPIPSAECCWPTGEPGTKTFRYCGANSLPGKPYCDEHAKRAVVKVRDRREDAGQRAEAMGAD